IVHTAAQMGLKPSPYAVLADYNREGARANIIKPTQNDPGRGARLRSIMASWDVHLRASATDWPLQNTAIHVNHGARDLEHFYACYRRNAFLMPVLMMLMENRPPYISGKRVKTHQGIIARSVLGARGGIPDAFFRTRD